ncbi:phage major capsid protein [Nonomuraea wenchangensis]|uniref:Phage major capsid protein, HK97 family n=1 Tax=Nonomuraea wenchangensis TaxID=568860 RepID=A0A1I0EDA5_9ACTN|nr:phage major capsid protein [Nonomuraea wenchangensis]SET43283.1 phage major capsid protein, HK97 family [Nonomuraea wenchangensis]
MNLTARLTEVENELRSIHEGAGGDALTAEAEARWDELVTERDSLNASIRKDEERRALANELAAKPANVQTGDGVRSAPNVIVKRSPFEAIENRSGMSGQEYRKALVDANLRAAEGLIDGAANEKRFEYLVKRHAGDTDWAKNILARSRPEYTSAWSKLMRGRPEMLTSEERAALAVSTNTQGGYLVPTHLDPTLILTNDGSSNVMRSIARVVTLTNGANVWHGVSTAGVTASWDGELTEVSDDSPSLVGPSIPVHSAKSLVQASIEAFEDIDNLSSDVLMMFADARDRLEGAAHMTGSGSNQPRGIFTALDANTNVELVSTTAATIGEVDLSALYKAVPVRYRRNSSWVMNPLYNLAIKRLGTAVSSAFSGDLRLAPTDAILGRPVVESDDAPSTQTTTVRDNEIVFGDFSNYVIVDKPGSTSVEFIPHMFNPTTNLPDGRRAWYMHFRTGADSVNDGAFRLLQDKTSA